MAIPGNPEQDPAPDPNIGRVIAGNFRIVKWIGGGAMGSVYQAEQKSLGKMVAMKLLHSELMTDDKLIRRFELEAKSASSLNHPNSIQIIDFGRDSDILYIAMELLSGRDLSQVIATESPLPLDRIARIMDQVLAALEEAHEHKIVHRDLKPSNIMLVSRREERDFVKVCDFGIAKARRSDEPGGEMLTLKGLVCGTPEYMSPEQARGEEVDDRADLYAAAVILYQLVAGELPFTATSPVALLSKHLVERPVAPSARRQSGAMPSALESLILRGMEKNASDRPQSAAAFRQELRAIFPHVFATPTANVGANTGPVLTPSRERMLQAAETVSDSRLQAVKRTRWVTGAITIAAVGLATLVLLPVVRRAPPDQALPPAAKALEPPPGTHPRATLPLQPATPAVPPDDQQASASTVMAPPLPDRKTPVAAGHAGKKDPGKNAGATASKKVAMAQIASSTNPPGSGTEGTAALPGATPAAAGLPSLAIATTPPSATPTPATLGVREIMHEAERLLGQGEVATACAKGEEAKRMNPKAATNYRFLGKCYNRAGDHLRANENFRRYLELAPDAADAPFIQSTIK